MKYWPVGSLSIIQSIKKKYSGHVATDTTARTIEKSYWGKIGEGETKQNEIFIHHNW